MRRTHRGFAVIELLLVISIIGLAMHTYAEECI